MKGFSIDNRHSEAAITITEAMVASLVEELKPEVVKLPSTIQSITFDMEDITMIDSIGIGFLVATHNSLKIRGGAIKVINVNAEISELFESMHLNRHFSIERE